MRWGGEWYPHVTTYHFSRGNTWNCQKYGRTWHLILHDINDVNCESSFQVKSDELDKHICIQFFTETYWGFFFFFNKHKSQRQRMGEEEAAATSEAGKYMDEW